MTYQKRIGRLLLDAGLIDQPQLDEALSKQESSSSRLGEILMSLGYVTEVELLKELARQQQLLFQEKIELTRIDRELIHQVPLNFVRRNNMLPLFRQDGKILILTNDPMRLAALDNMRLLLKESSLVIVSSTEEVQRAIDSAYSREAGTAQDVVDDLHRESIDLLAELSEDQEDLLDSANKAPIIKLVNLILSQAVKDRASDVHLEPYENEFRVRHRVDGILHNVLSPPKKYQAAIVSRIKIMARLNIAERRLPQDGRIKIVIGGRPIDIRVSVIPTANGERIVLRLLDQSNLLLDLEKLGFPDDVLTKMNWLITHYHGIILVTGPTGSGKTTTLYSAINKINSEEKNILTIEDPIEYLIPGIGQMEVKPQIGFTFANGLRSMLRQDPDVMLVGEIRDLETAEIAVQASLTGHLVFSTLHTTDAAGAIGRLVDMKVEPYLIASTLMGVLAQRLVRTLCPNCKESYQPDEKTLRQIGLTTDDVLGKTLYQGKGCDKCLGTGYRGRTGIYELLVMNKRIQKLMVKNPDTSAIKKEAVRGGMATLRVVGGQKVLAGVTTVAEVLRVTQEDME